MTWASALPAGAGVAKAAGAPFRPTVGDRLTRGPSTMDLASYLLVCPGAQAGSISGVPREPGTTILTLRANSNPGDGAEPAMKTCSITVKPAVLELTSGCSSRRLPLVFLIPKLYSRAMAMLSFTSSVRVLFRLIQGLERTAQ